MIDIWLIVAQMIPFFEVFICTDIDIVQFCVCCVLLCTVLCRCCCTPGWTAAGWRRARGGRSTITARCRTVHSCKVGDVLVVTSPTLHACFSVYQPMTVGGGENSVSPMPGQPAHHTLGDQISGQAIIPTLSQTKLKLGRALLSSRTPTTTGHLSTSVFLECTILPLSLDRSSFKIIFVQRISQTNRQKRCRFCCAVD